MKLIDADKLLNPGYTDVFDEPIKFTMISVKAIEAQPIVEAIPISWIEKWVRNDRTADPDTFIDMISDWRKENETDRREQTESAGIR